MSKDKVATKEEAKKQSLSPIKRKVTLLVKSANDLTIETDDQMEQATDILSKIKTVGKTITERKEQITKPLNEALKSTRALFKPIEKDNEAAERIIKDKMLDFQLEADRKREEQETKLRARVGRGTMKDETADRKIDELGEVKKTVVGQSGATSFKDVRVVKVTDVTKVPDEYLQTEAVIDVVRKAVKADALDGKTIPGVEVVIEKQVASR